MHVCGPCVTLETDTHRQHGQRRGAADFLHGHLILPMHGIPLLHGLLHGHCVTLLVQPLLW